MTPFGGCGVHPTKDCAPTAGWRVSGKSHKGLCSYTDTAMIVGAKAPRCSFVNWFGGVVPNPRIPHFFDRPVSAPAPEPANKRVESHDTGHLRAATPSGLRRQLT